jgi:hypothetical protein
MGAKVESGKTGAGTAFAVLMLGGILTLAGKSLADGQETSAAATELTALVGMGVTVFGAVVLAWWALSFCCAVAVELLIRRGSLKAARRIGAFAPTFMRRAACLTLGMNLIAAPAAYAGTGDAQSYSASQQIHAAEEASTLSPHWDPVEALQVLEPSWRPTTPAPGGSLLVKETSENRPSAAAQEEVVVQPGDSLWTITARHLGPHASEKMVAETWPRWYEANRDVIGANPELLQPGQILHPPTATPSASH